MSSAKRHLTALNICLGLLMAAITAHRAGAEPVVLTNLSYFDSYSKTMVETDRLVIDEGVIQSIGGDSCGGCREINLNGGYVIPGLIDIHQHLNPGGFAEIATSERITLFKRNLYFGITAALNPSIPDNIRSLLEPKVKATPEDFPRFLHGGRMIGPEGGWGDLKTSTVGGLKAAIEKQIAAGAAIIHLAHDDKAWLTDDALPVFSEQALRSAIGHAHIRERRVFVHTTSVPHAETALRLGADGIISGLIAGRVTADTIALFKANRAIYVATLSPFYAIANVERSVRRQQAYDPDLVNARTLYDSMASDIMAQNWLDWYPKSNGTQGRLKRLQENSMALIRGGVQVGLGTDAGTPTVIFGASMADEMVLHGEMGVSAGDVITMATLANARTLNLGDATGSIEVGKVADLVILKQDPTKALSALKTIEYSQAHMI